MATVYYDGEEVTFEGEAPKNLGTLLDVLQGNAISQGHALVSFKVDGKEAIDSDVNLLGTDYQKVEAQTMKEAELFVSAIDTTLGALAEPEETIDDILSSLMTDEWPVAFNRLNDFLQGLADYFELCSNLVIYGESTKAAWLTQLQEANNKLEMTFGGILKKCETQEVEELTTLINEEFRPNFLSSLSLIRGDIRRSFEG